MSEKIFTKYIPDFILYCKVEKKLSEKSVKSYLNFLSKYLHFVAEKQKYTKLTPKQITQKVIWDYRLYLEKQGLSETTQILYLISLRNLLRYLAEIEVKSLNPEKIKLPRKTYQKEIDILTRGEMKR